MSFDFNTSHWDFPNIIWFRHSNEEIILKVASLFPIVIFGIIVNIILLFIIAQNRLIRTSPTNILIGNMTCADLATLSISPLMFIYHDSYQNYVLGPVGCRLEGFLQGGFLITSVLNLCAISYDRLSAIVIRCGSARMTKERAKLFIVGSWICGMGLALPLMCYRFFVVRHWKNFTEKFCAENFVILSVYWHVIIATLVWIPFIVMVLSYTAIFLKLSYYEKQLLKRETPISVLHKRKITKMVFIILVTFVVLRLPFTMLIFIREHKLQLSQMNQLDGTFYLLWYTSHYMMFVNAAVNPVIYGLMNKNFRRALSQTRFCGCFERLREKPVKKNNRLGAYKGPAKINLEPRDPCVRSEHQGTVQVLTVSSKSSQREGKLIENVK